MHDELMSAYNNEDDVYEYEDEGQEWLSENDKMKWIRCYLIMFCRFGFPAHWSTCKIGALQLKQGGMLDSSVEFANVRYRYRNICQPLLIPKFI